MCRTIKYGNRMSATVPLTNEQRAYIVAHLNDRPRTDVARAAGVSMAVVYRIVRECGGEMLYNRSQRNPEWERIVRKYYPTMAGHEIERQFGITPNRANKIAQDLGLTHNPETQAKLQAEARDRLMKGRINIDQERKAKRWKATRRLDQFRVWEGKPQQTAFIFSRMTKRAYKAKHYLIRKYRYKADAADPYTLLYDNTTSRRPLSGGKWGTEEYYAAKYKLQFKQEE